VVRVGLSLGISISSLPIDMVTLQPSFNSRVVASMLRFP
jgi:hypothetical protein